MLRQPTQTKKRPLEDLSLNRSIFEKDFEVIKNPPQQDIFKTVIQTASALLPSLPVAKPAQPTVTMSPPQLK